MTSTTMMEDTHFRSAYFLYLLYLLHLLIKFGQDYLCRYHCTRGGEVGLKYHLVGVAQYNKMKTLHFFWYLLISSSVRLQF